MPDSRELLDEGIRREMGGALDDARRMYARACDATDDPDIVAEAWRRLADVHRAQCRWDEALDAARRSAVAAEAAGLRDRVAEAINAEASVHLSRSDFAMATPLFERVLALAEDDRLRGIALQNLGAVAAQSGDLSGAERRFADSYDAFRRAGYTRGEALALNNQGRAALDRGDPLASADLLGQALALARAVQDTDLVALVSLNLAEALAEAGEAEHAEELLSGSLGFFATNGNEWRRVECLRLLGDLLQRRGEGTTAVRCWQQGLDVARRIGARLEEQALAQRLDGAGG